MDATKKIKSHVSSRSVAGRLNLFTFGGSTNVRHPILDPS